MRAQPLIALARDIKNKRVLAARQAAPRHEFVPAIYRSLAYTDQPLPIGYGQTISQPYIVAFMTEKLDPQPTDRALEIGAGSGYLAAVLSRLVAEVYAMEIVEPLARQAQDTLDRLGYHNVKISWANGQLGWPAEAPFDKIIISCAAPSVPQRLIDQLKEGGRLIAPIGSFNSQELLVAQKIDGRLVSENLIAVRFVPMTGDEAPDADPV